MAYGRLHRTPHLIYPHKETRTGPQCARPGLPDRPEALVTEEEPRRDRRLVQAHSHFTRVLAAHELPFCGGQSTVTTPL
jgi:hypothetical protein